MTGFLQTPVADQGARHRYMEAAEWRWKKRRQAMSQGMANVGRAPLSPGSSVEGRSPGLKRGEGGDERTYRSVCLTFTSIRGWMDGQKDGLMGLNGKVGQTETANG